MIAGRCSRCSHPLQDGRASPFARGRERLVCGECADDEEPDDVTVVARADGGKPL